MPGAGALHADSGHAPPVPAPPSRSGGDDVDAFCRELHPQLLGSLRLYLGDAETARELTQDALVRVIERWPQVATMDHPKAWAYRVAFNLAHSRLRRVAAERRAGLAQAPRPKPPVSPSPPHQERP